MARQLTQAALAAKMIRKNLTAQGLKVRVRSDNFSMGDSVDVHMTDQPPKIVKLVEAYCQKFQYGHFDGMIDCYEYSNTRKDIPQSKFVHVHNEISPAMLERVYQHIRTEWHGGDQLPATFEEAQKSYIRFQNECLDLFVYRLFRDENSTFWREPEKAATA